MSFAAFLRKVVDRLDASDTEALDTFLRQADSDWRPISALGMTLVGISPEDLVLSKLRWASTTDSERQIRDAFGVLAIHRADLDEEYLRSTARGLGVSETLERLLRDSKGSA